MSGRLDTTIHLTASRGVVHLVLCVAALVVSASEAWEFTVQSTGVATMENGIVGPLAVRLNSSMMWSSSICQDSFTNLHATLACKGLGWSDGRALVGGGGAPASFNASECATRNNTVVYHLTCAPPFVYSSLSACVVTALPLPQATSGQACPCSVAGVQLWCSMAPHPHPSIVTDANRNATPVLVTSLLSTTYGAIPIVPSTRVGNVPFLLSSSNGSSSVWIGARVVMKNPTVAAPVLVGSNGTITYGGVAGLTVRSFGSAVSQPAVLQIGLQRAGDVIGFEVWNQTNGSWSDRRSDVAMAAPSVLGLDSGNITQPDVMVTCFVNNINMSDNYGLDSSAAIIFPSFSSLRITLNVSPSVMTQARRPLDLFISYPASSSLSSVPVVTVPVLLLNNSTNVSDVVSLLAVSWNVSSTPQVVVPLIESAEFVSTASFSNTSVVASPNRTTPFFMIPYLILSAQGGGSSAEPVALDGIRSSHALCTVSQQDHVFTVVVVPRGVGLSEMPISTAFAFLRQKVYDCDRDMNSFALGVDVALAECDEDETCLGILSRMVPTDSHEEDVEWFPGRQGREVLECIIRDVRRNTPFGTGRGSLSPPPPASAQHDRLLHIQSRRSLPCAVRWYASNSSGEVSLWVQGTARFDVYRDAEWIGQCGGDNSNTNATAASCSVFIPCQTTFHVFEGSTLIAVPLHGVEDMMQHVPCPTGASRILFHVESKDVAAVPPPRPLWSIPPTMAAALAVDSTEQPQGDIVMVTRQLRIPRWRNLVGANTTSLSVVVHGVMAVHLVVAQCGFEWPGPELAFGMFTTTALLPPVTCGAASGFTSSSLLGRSDQCGVGYFCSEDPFPVLASDDNVMVTQIGAWNPFATDRCDGVSLMIIAFVNRSTSASLLSSGFVMEESYGYFNTFLAVPSSETVASHFSPEFPPDRVDLLPSTSLMSLRGNLLYAVQWAEASPPQLSLSSTARLAVVMDAVPYPEGGVVYFPVPATSSGVRVLIQNANLWDVNQSATVEVIWSDGSVTVEATVGGGRPFADGTPPSATEQTCLTFPLAVMLQWTVPQQAPPRFIVLRASYQVMFQVRCLYGVLAMAEFFSIGNESRASCAEKSSMLCSGRCVTVSAICNGIYDCPDGEDERFCSSWVAVEENAELIPTIFQSTLPHTITSMSIPLPAEAGGHTLSQLHTACFKYGLVAISAFASTFSGLQLSTLYSAFNIFSYDHISRQCFIAWNATLASAFVFDPVPFLRVQVNATVNARLPGGPVTYNRCSRTLSCSGHGDSIQNVWAGVPFCGCICDAGFIGDSCQDQKNLLTGLEQILVGFPVNATFIAPTRQSTAQVLAGISSLPISYSCGPYARRDAILYTLCEVASGTTQPWLPFAEGVDVLGYLSVFVSPKPVVVGVAPFPQAQHSTRLCSSSSSFMFSCRTPTLELLAGLVMLSLTFTPHVRLNVSLGLGTAVSAAHRQRSQSGTGTSSYSSIVVSCSPGSDRFSWITDLGIGIYALTCGVDVETLTGGGVLSILDSFNVTLEDTSDATTPRLMSHLELVQPVSVSWVTHSSLPTVDTVPQVANARFSQTGFAIAGFVVMSAGVLMLIAAVVAGWTFYRIRRTCLSDAVALTHHSEFVPPDPTIDPVKPSSASVSILFEFLREALLLDRMFMDLDLRAKDWQRSSIVGGLVTLAWWILSIFLLVYYYTSISYVSNTVLMVELYADGECDRSANTPSPFFIVTVPPSTSHECKRRAVTGSIAVNGYTRGWCEQDPVSGRVFAYFAAAGSLSGCLDADIHATPIPPGVCLPRNSVQFAKFTCGSSDEVNTLVHEASKSMSGLSTEVPLFGEVQPSPQGLLLPEGPRHTSIPALANNHQVVNRSTSQSSPPTSSFSFVFESLGSLNELPVDLSVFSLILQLPNETFRTYKTPETGFSRVRLPGVIKALEDQIASASSRIALQQLVEAIPSTFTPQTRNRTVPFGVVYNHFETPQQVFGSAAAQGAIRYTGVEDTYVNLGNFFDSVHGDDGSAVHVKLYLRASQNSIGFVYAVTDTVVDTTSASGSSPLLDAALSMIATSNVGSLWPFPYSIYHALHVDGPSRTLRFVFTTSAATPPTSAASLVVIEWDIDALGVPHVFNGLWHHVVVVLRRENGLTKAQLIIDGETSLFRVGWNQCVGSNRVLVAHRLSVGASVPITSGQYVSDRATLWTGYFNGGISGLEFVPQRVSMYDLWLTTSDTIRQHNALHRRGFLALGGVLVAAAVLVAASSCYGMKESVMSLSDTSGEQQAELRAKAFVTYTRLVHQKGNEVPNSPLRREDALLALMPLRNSAPLPYVTALRWLSFNDTNLLDLLEQLLSTAPNRLVAREQLMQMLLRCFTVKAQRTHVCGGGETTEVRDFDDDTLWTEMVASDATMREHSKEADPCDPVALCRGFPGVSASAVAAFSPVKLKASNSVTFLNQSPTPDPDLSGLESSGTDFQPTEQSGASASFNFAKDASMVVGGNAHVFFEAVVREAQKQVKASLTNKGEERKNDEGANDRSDGDDAEQENGGDNNKEANENQTGQGSKNNGGGDTSIAVGVSETLLTIFVSALSVLQIVQAWSTALVLPTEYLNTFQQAFSFLSLDWTPLIGGVWALSLPIAEFFISIGFYIGLMFVLLDDSRRFGRFVAHYMLQRSVADEEAAPRSVVKRLWGGRSVHQHMFDLMTEFHVSPRRQLEAPLVRTLPFHMRRLLDQFLGLRGRGHQPQEDIDSGIQRDASRLMEIEIESSQATDITRSGEIKSIAPAALLGEAIGSTLTLATWNNSKVHVVRPDMFQELSFAQCTTMSRVRWERTANGDMAERFSSKNTKDAPAPLRTVTYTCLWHPQRRLRQISQSSVFPFDVSYQCCIAEHRDGKACGCTTGKLYVCQHVEEDGPAGEGEDHSCTFAVCENHYRAPLIDALLSEALGWLLSLERKGLLWLVALILLTLADAVYTPIMKTAMMILACHPQYQCEFDTCSLGIDQKYTLAFFLALVAVVFFGVGFPVTVSILLHRRVGAFHVTFNSEEFSRQYLRKERRRRQSKQTDDHHRTTSSVTSAAAVNSPRLEVSSKEWLRFSRSDPSVIATLYKGLHYKWIYLSPILLLWKTILLAPIVFLSPGTFEQSVSVAVVQIAFALFLRVTWPFSTPFANNMYALGSVHQLLFLAIQNFDVVARYDYGERGGYDAGIIGVTSVYFALCGLSAAWLVVEGPVTRYVHDRNVQRVMQLIGLCSARATTLYVDPTAVSDATPPEFHHHDECEADTASVGRVAACDAVEMSRLLEADYDVNDIAMGSVDVDEA